MRTLRFGDSGDDVGQLQRDLVRASYPLDVTNLYDDSTKAAVVTLQQKAGLIGDGIVGPKTYAALAIRLNDSRRLTARDIERAAKRLDVPVACVLAVREVESRGAGFLLDGRPVILFERHVFWKRLNARGIDPTQFAKRNPNILSKTPGGYKGDAAEYSRLAAAEFIHASAARESASWGAFQVMGYHWERLGYPSIDDFVDRMKRSTIDHLDAFVRYVAADAMLAAALKAEDWVSFARCYNGPKYAEDQYDVKLKQAFERFAARDAAVTPSDSATV